MEWLQGLFKKSGEPHFTSGEHTFQEPVGQDPGNEPLLPVAMFDWDSQKDFLNVNAAVERCTSDMLFQPDYEQNLALVDKLQETPKLMDTYLSAIQRRMQNPSEEVVLSLCVTLIETILKNCPGAVELWGRREHQEAVVQICVTTKHLRAREPLLELVQALGIAYKDDKALVYEQAYRELMGRHKISFPPPSKTPFVAPTAPNKRPLSPPRDQGVQRLHKSGSRTGEVDPFDPTGIFMEEESYGQYEQVRSAPRSRTKSGSKSAAKHQSIEDQLDSVSSTLSLLNDILDALGPKDRVQDNELIGTIVPTVQSLHETIIRVLQGDMSSFDETLTARLFSANDAIAETLEKYDKAKKGILPQKQPNRAPQAPPAPAHHVPPADDFDDEFSVLATRKRPQTKAATLGMTRSSTAGPAADPFLPSPNNPFLVPTQSPALTSVPPAQSFPLDLLMPTDVQNPQNPSVAPSILQPTYKAPYNGSDSLI